MPADAAEQPIEPRATHAEPEDGQDRGLGRHADAGILPEAHGEVDEDAGKERLRRREQQLHGNDVERARDGFTDSHGVSIRVRATCGPALANEPLAERPTPRSRLHLSGPEP